MGDLTKVLEMFVAVLIASILLLVVGVIYFMVTAWIIDMGMAMLGIMPDDNSLTIGASIVAGAAIVGSAIGNKQ